MQRDVEVPLDHKTISPGLTEGIWGFDYWALKKQDAKALDTVIFGGKGS